MSCADSLVLGAIVLAVLAFAAWREREHRQERELLVQRIQAPEKAVVAFDRSLHEQDRKPAVVIAVDDDEAMKRAIESRRSDD